MTDERIAGLRRLLSEAKDRRVPSALAAAAVNALPGLLDLVESLRRQVAANEGVDDLAERADAQATRLGRLVGIDFHGPGGQSWCEALGCLGEIVDAVERRLGKGGE